MATPRKKPEDKVKTGRPTKYTEKLGDWICQIISTHSGGMPTLCKKFPELPEDTTIYQWRIKYPEFSRKYMLAKQEQADVLVEELQEISRNVYNYIFIDSEGNKKIDPGAVAASKLQTDTNKWLASKLIPKVYGDQKQIDELKGHNEIMLKELMELRAQLAEKNKKDY